MPEAAHPHIRLGRPDRKRHLVACATRWLADPPTRSPAFPPTRSPAFPPTRSPAFPPTRSPAVTLRHFRRPELSFFHPQLPARRSGGGLQTLCGDGVVSNPPPGFITEQPRARQASQLSSR